MDCIPTVFWQDFCGKFLDTFKWGQVQFEGNYLGIQIINNIMSCEYTALWCTSHYLVFSPSDVWKNYNIQFHRIFNFACTRYLSNKLNIKKCFLLKKGNPYQFELGPLYKLGSLDSPETMHGSYEWIIMLEKCGRLDLTDFHLIWVMGTYGNWKKSNSWGSFWSYQLNSIANPAHLPHKLGQMSGIGSAV